MLARTLLAHVGPLITIQVENLATNALDYLLEKYPPAAEAFVRLARRAAPDLPETLKFRTQVRWEDGAIPDMVGWHGEAQVLLVESKFWADLTPNQPVAYLKRFPAASFGLVLVICPEGRASSLWRELTHLCSTEGMTVGSPEDAAPGLKATSVSARHKLALVTWQALLTELESAMAGTDQRGGVADLDQLRGLCEQLDRVPMQSLSPGSPRETAVSDLTAFVDDVAALLVASGHAQVQGYRATPGAVYYKRYMALHGWGNWCVEWNYDYLARFGQTSLWLSTTATKAQQPRLKLLEDRLEGHSRHVGTQFVIPLSGPDGLRRHELLQQVLEKIRGLHQSFLASEFSAGPG